MLSPAPASPSRRRTIVRTIPPVAVAAVVALMPTPPGLSQDAWYYFALFAAVIVGIITEPIPAPAVGLTGVVIAAMSGLVYKNPSQAINWALSGFSNNLAWLIFASIVLASGYQKTGLGKRIALWLITRLGKHTLGLGYAVALADLALAPASAVPGLPGRISRRAAGAGLGAGGVGAQGRGGSLGGQVGSRGCLRAGVVLPGLAPPCLYGVGPPRIKVPPGARVGAAADP